jgi:Tol biopolymer transport system component
MGLFEIDLTSGRQRRLGGPLLDEGMVMFGAISPDGKSLAVTQGLAQQKLLEQQVVIVDLPGGQSRRLGKPLDCAYLSWLPKGDGVILVSRKNKSLFEAPEGTVSRLNLKGELIALFKGDNPFALSPKSLILFQMPTEPRQWMTSDLDGKGAKPVLDGLPKYRFPTASPDAKRLVMMKFGGPDGPKPNVIDLESGDIKEIPAGSGLWAWPVWR